MTGTFGNILPIDWSKTYARQLQLPTLNINQPATSSDGGKSNTNSVNKSVNDNSLVLDIANVDEEEIAHDLDLHSLILNSIQQEPIFTAEQVLEEIG